ncbi:hypothetical protein CC78DRAFT_590193 [Lojkania enalia]|uniref:Uncharacterized protein n=1 Tax=Lojkania enalia TaxID=147567 RepID=A0A9P4KJ36_9PLEO|nr:hypothetical protein CC78DRAFT_590193 [Didymosphaeria enalia]
MGKHNKSDGTVAVPARMSFKLPPPEDLKCYISGIEGLHPIRVGVAYYYRGHYIYGRSMNPLEPLPYSTKTKRMTIAGTIPGSAPPYDQHGMNLVRESDVGALSKAIVSECHARLLYETSEEAYDDHSEDEGPSLLADHQGDAATKKRPSTTKLATSDKYHDPDVDTAYVDEAAGTAADMRPPTTSTGQFYSPHDKAHFLAQSAPGSRLPSSPGSALNSAPGSPRPVPVREGVSSSRMLKLLAEEGIVPRSRLPFAEYHGETYADYKNTDTDHSFPLLASHSSAQLLAPKETLFSHSRSTSNSMRGLSMNSALSRAAIPNSGRATPIAANDGGLMMVDLPNRVRAPAPRNTTTPTKEIGVLWTHESPYDPVLVSFRPASPIDTGTVYTRAIGSGRPRKASIALNKAYNDRTRSSADSKYYQDPGYYAFGSTESVPANVTKCPIHSHGCDGESVAQLHLTEACRQGAGFRDLYPTISSHGRVMIDWQKVLWEVKDNM